MPEGLGWLIAVTSVGAAVLVAHVALLVGVFTSPTLTPAWKWASLVPPVAPVAGWRGKRRPRVIVWALLLVSYIVLRALW